MNNGINASPPPPPPPPSSSSSASSSSSPAVPWTLPVCVEGMWMFCHPYGRPMDEHIRDVRNMSLREDDVIICAFLKAGTHWVWEMCHMLLSGRADYEARTKENLMLEFVSMEQLNSAPSPRIFNTHLPFSMLPVDAMREKKVKLPNMWGMTLEHFLPRFLSGQTNFGKWSDYLRQMSSFIKGNPDMPIYNVSYEDIKKNPGGKVKELAQFLGVEKVNEQLCGDVTQACTFRNLKTANGLSKTLPQGTLINYQHLDFYRKGEVGDWRNHLTVAQSRTLDKHVAEECHDLDLFHFQYE